MRILLTGAYRLFFPAAGLFAALAIPLWLMLYMGVDFSLPEDSFRWHQHEMLFGYLGAALAGFLLTAIPNWTGRPALKGVPLLMLFLLWLIGRIGFITLPDSMGQTIMTLLFPVALAAIATREIWLGGNRRNLPVAGIVWLIAAADALFLLGEIAIAERMGFGLAVVLITLVGGRVTPAFARNWLRAKGRNTIIPAFGPIDKAAMITTIGAAASWVVLPDNAITGALALVSAAFLLIRLIRWKGWTVAGEPLLISMHLAYLWLPVSMLLLGTMILGEAVIQVQVVHAIGAGAVGSMTLIVMMRAMLGHAKQPIVGGKMDIAILGSVHIGAALRVMAPMMSEFTPLLHISGTLWALGFFLFFLRYGRIAIMARL